MSETLYICPVCGYDQLNAAPHTEGAGASDEICPSCGFQFGYTDDDQGITYEAWRAKWVSGGMPWSSVGTEQPKGWNPHEQLERLTHSKGE